MKRFALVIALSTLFVLGARAADVVAKRPLSGAPAVDQAWMAAMRANDLAAVMACYAPTATVWMPGEPRVDGTEAIRASFEKLFAENTVMDVLIRNARYETSGNLSTGWGEFTMTLSPKAGGEDVRLTGSFTEVAMRRGGKWVYVADHATLDPAVASH